MKVLTLLLFLNYSQNVLANCSNKKIINTLPIELKDRIHKVTKAVKRISKQLDVNHCMILSIVWTESTFKAYQTSNKGAKGLMQVVPNTANAMRLKLNYELNTLISSNLDHGLKYYEIENIILGTFYYKKLLKKFKGNYKKALVAYNSGSSYVYNNNIDNHVYFNKVYKKFNYINLK